MSFNVILFENDEPLLEGAPLCLMVNGQVVARTAVGAQGVAVFDADAATAATVAVRFDQENEQTVKPGTPSGVNS